MASPTDPEMPHGAEKEVMALELDKVQDLKEDVQMSEVAMDAELAQLEELSRGLKKPRFDFSFGHPEIFTYVLVGFASLGGLLSGLDQSLISGANLYMPQDLRLSDGQASLVNAGMPLGAVAGALILSPANEYLGRRMAIMVSCVLYTIGAALEAGAISFGIMFAGRFVLGVGVGLEGGTVPVYVAECGMCKPGQLEMAPLTLSSQSQRESAVIWSLYTSLISPWAKCLDMPWPPFSSMSPGTGAISSDHPSSFPQFFGQECCSSLKVLDSSCTKAG